MRTFILSTYARVLYIIAGISLVGACFTKLVNIMDIRARVTYAEHVRWVFFFFLLTTNLATLQARDTDCTRRAPPATPRAHF